MSTRSKRKSQKSRVAACPKCGWTKTCPDKFAAAHQLQEHTRGRHSDE